MAIRTREARIHRAAPAISAGAAPAARPIPPPRLPLRRPIPAPSLPPEVAVATPAFPRAREIAKRGFDFAVALPLLILVSPLIALAAVWIKLDSPGPVFFRQERVGQGRRSFQLLKLRSMSADAELRRAEVAALSLHGNGIHHGIFKAKNDPRITRAGAFMRRWSIDELPQLWNVIRGDMSMVGPRPLPLLEDGRVGAEYEARYDVRPGITGRWQVNGRSEVPLDGMLPLDCSYVEEWTLLEDAKLIARTTLVVARGRGAY